MEVESEKYTKLIQLAQKFNACQNELLHYQKQEVVDNWNTFSSGIVSDDSSSVLNIKKITKKTKRAKSCLVGCTYKPNRKIPVNKISPSKKKPLLTKLKTGNNLDLMNKYSLKSGIVLKGKYEDISPIYREKSKKWNSSVYVKSSRSGYLSNNNNNNNNNNKSNNNNNNNNNTNKSNNNNNNNNKSNNIDNVNAEKKTKLKRTITTLRCTDMKDVKCKSSVPVEKQEENKKKRKAKRKNNTFTIKNHDIIGLAKGPSNKKKHNKKSRSKEESKEDLKKIIGRENHFMNRKKRSCLKKKRKIRLKKICNLHNVDCNDSVDSAGSVISADTLESLHVSKTKDNELLFVSLCERTHQWHPPTVTDDRNVSEDVYEKHKQFILSISNKPPKKHLFNSRNDCTTYKKSEFHENENKQNKQELLMNKKQTDINKHLHMNQTNMKPSHKSEDIKHSSYKPTICKNVNNIENKSRTKDLLQKKKEPVQLTNVTFAENKTHPVICDVGDTCNSITNSVTSETKKNTSSGVEKKKTSKQLDVQAYKQLLKALNESAFLTITKKRQHKKSKRKNKRIARKTKAIKNIVKQCEEHK